MGSAKPRVNVADGGTSSGRAAADVLLSSRTMADALLGPRLDSALARILLDERHVSAATLEEAVRQQLLHGGALDTLLLEADAIDEATLTDALGRAWGTPKLSVSHIDQPHPTALSALPTRMALAMNVVPIFHDADGLHVAVVAPLDRGLIRELADLVKQAVIAHVVPEVRLRQAQAVAWGVGLDRRMDSLLRKLEAAVSAAVPVPAVPVETPHTTQSHDAAVAWSLADALGHLATQDSRDGVGRVAVAFARRFLPFAAMLGVRHGDAIGWWRSGVVEGARATCPATFFAESLAIPLDSVLHSALSTPSPTIGRPPIAAGNTAFLSWLGRRRPRTLLIVPIVVGGRAVGALVGDGGIRELELSELSELVGFSSRLGPALEGLLRQRRRAHPSVLPIENSQPAAPQTTPSSIVPATSFAAAVPGGTIRLDRGPGDGTSPFARDYVPPSPPTQDASIVDEASFQLPVLDRLPPVPGLFSVDESRAPAAWRGALQHTVERGLQGGTSHSGLRIFVEEDEDWEDVVYDVAHAKELDAAAARPLSPVTMAVTSVPTSRSAPMPPPGGSGPASKRTPSPDDLVDQLQGLDEGLVRDARAALISLGDAALPALGRGFPGRLVVDPFDPAEHVRRPNGLGPLIDVLAALEVAGLSVAGAHVDSRYPAHRYAAVLLFAHTPHPRAIELLRPRLHDHEHRVRDLAAEALLPLVEHAAFDGLLIHLRGRLHSPVIEARRRAMELVGMYRDVASIPLLIDGLEPPAPLELLEPARAALRLITCHDFGTKSRLWRRWWSKAKVRSHQEWLLDALEADEFRLRTQAGAELQRQIGDFGYRADGDKKSQASAMRVARQRIHQRAPTRPPRKPAPAEA